MKKYIISFCSAFLITVLAPVSADENCSGYVSNLYVERNGNLHITGTWNNQNNVVCNMSATWSNVSVDTCKSWLSIGQTALITNRKIVARVNVIGGICTNNNSSTYSPAYIKLL